MNIPDVIGLNLDQAKIELQKVGLRVGSIEITAPPKLKIQEYHDDFRVLRLKIMNDNSVELLICKPL